MMVIVQPALRESPARDAAIIGSRGSRVIPMPAGRMDLKPTATQPWPSTSLPVFHASFTPLKRRVSPDISCRFVARQRKRACLLRCACLGSSTYCLICRGAQTVRALYSCPLAPLRYEFLTLNFGIRVDISSYMPASPRYESV